MNGIDLLNGKGDPHRRKRIPVAKCTLDLAEMRPRFQDGQWIWRCPECGSTREITEDEMKAKGH